MYKMDIEDENECSGCGEFGKWCEINHEEYICEDCLIGEIR